MTAALAESRLSDTIGPSPHRSLAAQVQSQLGLLFALTTVVLGGFRASGKALWFDEAVSVAIVRRPAVPFLRIILTDEAGMTPYYLALWLWSQVFSSDFGLAMFSVVGGAVAVWVVYGLLNRHFGWAVAVVGGLLMLTNPFFLEYLTEIRAYSWIMALAAVAFVVVDRWAEQRNPPDIRLLGIVSGLLVSSHVVNIPFVAVLVISTFMLWPPLAWREAAPSLLQAALIATAIAISALPALIANGDQVSWIPSMRAQWAYSQARIALGAELATFVLMVALLLMATVLMLMRRPDARAQLWWLCAVAAPALVAVISLAKPLWLARYLAVSFPAVVLTCAWGVSVVSSALRSRRWRNVLLATVSVLLVLICTTQTPWSSATRLGDARAAAEWVDEHLAGGGAFASSAHEMTDFYHYFGYRPSIDLTLVAPPAESEVYPTLRSLGAVTDSRISSDMYVFVGWQGVSNDVFKTFDGRPYELAQFGRLSVLHVLPSVTND